MKARRPKRRKPPPALGGKVRPRRPTLAAPPRPQRQPPRPAPPARQRDLSLATQATRRPRKRPVRFADRRAAETRRLGTARPPQVPLQGRQPFAQKSAGRRTQPPTAPLYRRLRKPSLATYSVPIWSRPAQTTAETRRQTAS